MEYAAGTIVGTAIAALAACVGFDRDRSFYPTVLMVIAGYYVLFAVMAGSHEAILLEIMLASIFVVAAIVGFWKSLWLVVAGLIAHGVFDYVHHWVVDNPTVPQWWPGFCLAVDLTVGVWLGVLVTKRSKNAQERTP